MAANLTTTPAPAPADPNIGAIKAVYSFETNCMYMLGTLRSVQGRTFNVRMQYPCSGNFFFLMREGHWAFAWAVARRLLGEALREPVPVPRLQQMLQLEIMDEFPLPRNMR